MRKWRAMVGAGLFFVAFGFIVKTLWLDKPDQPLPRLLLRFEVRSDTDTQALILFNNDKGGRFVVPRSDIFQPITLIMPDTEWLLHWGIRIEPLAGTGKVVFRNIGIVEESGRVVRAIDPARNIESLNPRTAVSTSNGELNVFVATDADHAVLSFKGVFPLRTATDTLPRVTPVGLALMWGLMGGIAVSLLIRLAWCASRGATPVHFWVLGVFLTVLGARLMTLMFIAVSFPYWDPWVWEAWSMYLPYLDGNLSWTMMFSAINEHRVFFARVLSLGQFLVNGQWDNRFECLFTAGLYSAFAAGLWMMLVRVVRGRPWAVTALVLVATALPFSWENVVWGFQSQFYFFMGFSLLTLWFLTVAPVFSAGWWFGAFSALCALFTVGSGVAPTAVVAGVVIMRLIHARRGALATLATLGVCGVVGAIYAFTAVQQHNYGMLTKNVAQGIEVFGRVMSWPLSETIWLWVLLWLPMMVFGGRRLLSRASVRDEEWFLIALAGWGVINALGMAIYRGGFGGSVASRYSDITAVFVVVNGAALLMLQGECAGLWRMARAVRWGGAVWIALIGLGLLATTSEELRVNVADRVSAQRVHRTNIIRFLRDDDLGRLLGQRQNQLPFPDASFMAACLRNDRVLAFLPASIRKPIPVVPRLHAGFEQNGIQPQTLYDIYETVWGSFGPRGNYDQGGFESAPLAPLRFPYLEFEVQGAMPRKYECDTAYLHLKDPLTGEERGLASVHSMPGHWWLATIRVPCAMPVVVAVDQDPVWWLGFKEPREKSRCSVWADELIDVSPWVLGCGLIMLGIAAWGAGGSPRNFAPALPVSKPAALLRKAK